MDDKYLTVKEFATAANISQQAVYKQLNSRLKPYIKIKGNQKLIAVEALNKYYAADSSGDSTEVKQLEQPRSSAPNPAIQPKVEPVEQPNSTQIPPDKSQKELEAQIKELQEQIKEILKSEQEEKKFLRDQIIQKDKQIESLQDNLKMAQQLAAADKAKLLMLEEKQQEKEKEAVETPAAELKSLEEVRPPDPEEEEPKKKGFWARLFGF